jgi:hypothetical protein
MFWEGLGMDRIDRIVIVLLAATALLAVALVAEVVR